MSKYSLDAFALAAVAFANISAQRRVSGTLISQADAQIAAIYYSSNAAIATRNFADFAGCGIFIINPWEEKFP